MRFIRRRARPPAASDVSRVVAWGDQLEKVHRWLLDELTSAREQLGDWGRADEISPVLQAHCLSFCDALDAHHTGEDDGMFPHLEAENPELRSVIEQLRREHVTVARIVSDIRELLSDANDDGDLVGQLDELTSELREHFAYEERQLTAALNQLERLPWSEST